MISAITIIPFCPVLVKAYPTTLSFSYRANNRFKRDRQPLQSKPTRSIDFPPFIRQDLSQFENGMNTTTTTTINPFLQYGSDAEEKFIKSTRMLTERSYTRGNSFNKDEINEYPTINDLFPPEYEVNPWISIPYRIGILIVAFLSFPLLVNVLQHVFTIPVESLSQITSQLVPGISIIYGTFVAATLSILYNRKTMIMKEGAKEASILSMLAQNVLYIFQDNQEASVLACQCIADQIRLLIKGNRGEELMCIVYSDPYVRLNEILAEEDERLSERIIIENLMISEDAKTDAKRNGDGLSSRSRTLEKSCELIQSVIQVRSNRLSQEADNLPPTHFVMLTSFTLILLFGFTVSTLPSISYGENPSWETSSLFAIFCGVYILFYNFARDLNDPFRGSYQIRRSAASAQFLQTKWLFTNHQLLKGKIDFDANEDSDFLYTPGLGKASIKGMPDAVKRGKGVVNGEENQTSNMHIDNDNSTSKLITDEWFKLS